MRLLLILLLSAFLISGCSAGSGGSVESSASGTAHTPAGPLEWVEFHGLEPQNTQSRIQEYADQGYRLTSLAVSGTAAEPRYAIVMVKQTGPRWDYVLGREAHELQTALQAFAGNGLHPTQIVVLDGSSPALFAARVEETSTPTKWASAQTQTEFSNVVFPAEGPAPKLLSFDFYDGLGKVATVWQERPAQGAALSVYWGQSEADVLQYGDLFEAARYRRAFQDVDPTDGFSTLWTGDAVRGQEDVTGVDEAGWQAALESARQRKLVPLYVQTGGSGAGTLYSGSFAHALEPEVNLTVTGQTASADLQAFDPVVEDLMKEFGIRAATLAVGYQGRLVVARGYTLADSTYPVTQPTTMLRIASVSKPVTTVAIHQLLQQGKLTYDTRFQDILNLTTPSLGAPTDPRFSHITIGELLSMLGGWDADGTGFDPMFADTTIAAAFNAPLPVTKYMIASYMAGQTLDNPPGTTYSYSNFGFSLLGQVIERLRPGFTYTDAVRDSIWEPLGVTRPFLSNPLQSGLAPGEAEYQEYFAYIDNSVMTPDAPLVASFYGTENITNMDSHGGWVLAAADYVKMLTAFDQGANNPLLDLATTEKMFTPLFPHVDPGMAAGWFLSTLPDRDGNQVDVYDWEGLLNSDTSVMFRRADGLSVVLLTNQGQPDGGIGWPYFEKLNAAANTVTDWGTEDLFPSVGIPSFPQD